MPPILNFYHLRRISTHQKGLLETGKHEQNLILLDTMTKFGRNPDMVDVVLTSAVYSNMISRNHAEIVGKRNSAGRFEKYFITDNSLNGTYINDHRISGSVELKEGDVIKFGHMNGAAVRPGQTAPQANAEFAFIVEKALPTYHYLGFSQDGSKRVRAVMCRGNADTLQEVSVDIKDNNAAAEQQNQTGAPTTTAAACSVAGTPAMPASSSNLSGWPTAAFPYAGGSLSFPVNYNQLFTSNPNLLMQLRPGTDLMAAAVAAQQSLRMNASSAGLTFAGAGAGYPSTSTTGSFLANNLGGAQFNMQTNPLMSSLLQQQQQHAHQQQQHQQQLTAAQQQQRIAQQKSAPVIQQNQNPTVVQKVKQGSPTPMECDSSVPSPPKPHAHNTSNSVSKQRSESASSPVQQEEQQSEHLWSMADSPQPPRAPAPVGAHKELSRTPSPVTEHQPTTSSATLLIQEEQKPVIEKNSSENRPKSLKMETDVDEEKPEKHSLKEISEKVKKERRESTSSGKTPHRKSNEIARLFQDLEGSYMTMASRSEQKKSIGEKEKDKEKTHDNHKEKEKQREKEKERERQREKEREKERKEAEKAKKRERELREQEERVKELERKKKEKEKAKPKEPVKQHRLMKQLSDVSSGSDSDSSVERTKKKALPPPKKKEKEIKEPPKKMAKKRASGWNEDGNSSSSESGNHSDDEVPVKRKSPPRKPIHKDKEREKPVPKKRGRKPRTKKESDSEEEETPKTVFHDPIETCAMAKECNRPQSENVNWIQCDDCDDWYHAICILGKEELPNIPDFHCGCKDKKASKGKKKAR